MNCELCGENIQDGLRLCADCDTPIHGLHVAAASEIRLLKLKAAALERLVIELAMISISSEHFTDTRKSQVSRLLDELQYAGLDEPEATMRRHEKR